MTSSHWKTGEIDELALTCCLRKRDFETVMSKLGTSANVTALVSGTCLFANRVGGGSVHGASVIVCLLWWLLAALLDAVAMLDAVDMLDAVARG